MFVQDAASPPDLVARLGDLNAEQLRAATAPADRPLLVLAGAGTGKTTTLSARVAWLIEQGIPPERILLLTFTRRAAAAMTARTRALLERTGAAHRSAPPGRVLAGTFHSVAWRLVRLHAEALDLPPHVTVIDASDAADLIDVVRQELGHADRSSRFPRKGTLADIYSRTVNAQRPLSEILAEQFPWCLRVLDEIVGIFRAYGERKRASHLLDLDDLLLYWRALAVHDHAGPKLAALFDHVLVDEYQDVNGVQVDIARALHDRGAGLTVVGDDLQAIYGFRAASAEHILEFPALFPDARVVALERNYRSTQPILDAANALSTQVGRAHAKRLRSAGAGGARPELVLCRDETEEACEVTDRVLAEHERGTPLREQAVLMRAGHHSDLLELELGRRRIPFVKYGGIRYLEAAHVKDFLALLRLVVNPADEVSWFRVLQLVDHVGPSTARRALDVLDLARPDAWPEQWTTLELREEGRVEGAALLEALARAHALREPGEQAQLLQRALTPFLRRRYPDAEVRLLDLALLTDQAARAGSLERFAAELVLDPPQSSSDLAGPPHLDEDYLVLSTIHSAKGLEWDAVHVIHASDGNLPSDMALGSPAGLDEERRLLYVALTRARRTLQIYAPLRYFHQPRGSDDRHGLGNVSRFLSEEVRACCEVTAPAEPEPQLAGAEVHEAVAVAVDELWR
jgi:DNA helicase-2/ATP-dependent DNA helicase PcrA